MVEPPAQCFGKHDPLIRPHPVYRELAIEPDRRCARYRALVMEDIDPAETDAIRSHLQRQHLYDPNRFRRDIEAQLGHTVGPRKIGRPRKASDTRKTSKFTGKVHSDLGFGPGFAPDPDFPIPSSITMRTYETRHIAMNQKGDRKCTVYLSL